jgi:hypothetical protein
MKLCTGLALLLASASTNLEAQGARGSYAFSTIKSSPAAMIFTGDSRPETGLLGDGSKDHRYTGMYVGLGLGAVLVVLNLAHCDNSDTGCDSGRTISRAPVALVFLGGLGALIGRAFRKHDSPSKRDNQ